MERPGRGEADIIVKLDDLNIGSVVFKDRADNVRFVVSVSNHMDHLSISVTEYDREEFLSAGTKRDVAVSFGTKQDREAAA